MRTYDTIVAPITATGGAVAWIRISGPDAFPIARSLMPSFPLEPQHHQAVFGLFASGDSGISLPFRSPGGYTGEDAVEISTHGSLVSVGSLVDEAIATGARLASPGEFSLRAFMNGKIDLSEAEAVRDTVNAVTERQLRMANAQRSGYLSQRVSDVRDRTLKLLSSVEASVDFSEEIGDLDTVLATQILSEMAVAVHDLLETSEAGRVIRNGLRIAIIGPPNAGKSSLLNRLLGTDRAIVTPIPGTTRDTIEETAVLGGIPCVLIDTAGLRHTEEQIELLGIQRARHASETADAVWFVYDAAMGPPDELPSHHLLIANKADLETPTVGLPLSAKTGAGVDALSKWIVERYHLDAYDVVVDPRHVPHLQSSLEAIREAHSTLANDLPHDLLSVHLRTISHELGVITGETASADMIDRIFSDFCIGK